MAHHPFDSTNLGDSEVWLSRTDSTQEQIPAHTTEVEESSSKSFTDTWRQKQELATTESQAGSEQYPAQVYSTQGPLAENQPKHQDFGS